MRIQHNIAALNSYRQLSGNNSAVSKNLEKLSSGYKINRAGDDAAGLAISEKMRAQITGLETAQKNANDGISLVQTAEGALTEVHSMLNRMVELADQSANGTYDNETDRANLQKEVKSLLDEVDRIADSTNFNGINLLDGSLSTTELNVKATSATIGSTAVDKATISENPATGAKSIITGDAGSADATKTLTVEYADANGKVHSVKVDYEAKVDKDDNITNIAEALKKNGELSAIFDIAKNGDNVELTSKVTGSQGVKLTDVKTTDTKGAKRGDITDGTDATVTVKGLANAKAGESFSLNGKTYEFVADTATKPTTEGATAIVVGADPKDTVANINKALEKEGVQATRATNDVTLSAIQNGKGLTLQIGDTADDFNQLTVSVGNMKAKSLGIADVDISTQAGAQAAVSKIKDAINSVSSTRGDLGAIQNRLEHTINNLSVTTENMTAAESRIRDTDMAKEMMSYTKNNILVQASQAMLAQANQIPQGVLQLLQ